MPGKSHSSKSISYFDQRTGTSLHIYGRMPVLDPGNKDRLKNWMRVLKWYGIAGEQAGKHPFPEQKAHDSQHLILCFSGIFFRSAQLYGELTSRRVLPITEFIDITRHLSEIGPQTLLIIGTPDNLSSQFLQKCAELHVDWGFITAIDIAGLSFCLAKQLVVRPQTSNVEIFDELSLSRIQVDNKGMYSSPAHLQKPGFFEGLKRNAWNTLVLHCHGDGAHARIGSGVLCGLTTDKELNLQNQPIGEGACEKNGNGYHCKRVHSKDKKIIVFGAVKAANIILFTCNGSSVAGDIYPSNASFLLSASEGIPATVLTTNRRIIFSENIFKLTVSAIRSGMRLSSVATILNDSHESAMNSRPYLLFGDPVAQPFPSARTSSLTRISNDANLACVSSPGNKLIRTNAHIYFLNRARKANDRMIVNETGNLVKLKKDLKLIESRTDRIGKLVASVQTICSDLVNRDENLRMILASIQARQVILSQILVLGLKLHSEFSSTGVWEPALDGWYMAMRNAFKSADDLMVELMDLYLLDGEVEIPVCDGVAHTKISDFNACERCNCITQLETGYNLRDEPVYNCIKCPTCGPVEMWEEGFPRIVADISQYNVRRKGTVSASIASCGKPNPLNELCTDAKVIYQLRDTGRGKICFRGRLKTFRKEKKIKLSFTEENSYEMHTLRVMSVQAGTFAYARQRIACIS